MNNNEYKSKTEREKMIRDANAYEKREVNDIFFIELMGGCLFSHFFLFLFHIIIQLFLYLAFLLIKDEISVNAKL